MTGRKRQLSETREDSSSPMKRGKEKKGPAAAAAPAAPPLSAAEREWEETDERLLAVTKSIMFAAGDGNAPSETNARMLLGLAQQQVRMVMAASEKRAAEQGRNEVTLRDVLLHFARHKMVLGRLLNHAKAAHLVISLSRQTKDDEDDEEKEEDGVPYEVEIPSSEDEAEESSEAGSTGEQAGAVGMRISKNSAYAQLEAAIDSLEAGFTAAELTDASFEDLTRQARDRRMATRVRRLREDVYKQFSEARQATFVSRLKPKKYNGQSESTLFTSWLGLPPLDYVLTYVVSWLAKEIVTQVVDDAYMCLLKENSSAPPRGRGPPSTVLTAYHYEEALRRNLGWRSRGDVLFGYIAPSE